MSEYNSVEELRYARTVFLNRFSKFFQVSSIDSLSGKTSKSNQEELYFSGFFFV